VTKVNHNEIELTENKVAKQIYVQKEKEYQYLLRNNGRTLYGTCKI
jgi:hypothetical protein